MSKAYYKISFHNEDRSGRIVRWVPMRRFNKKLRGFNQVGN